MSEGQLREALAALRFNWSETPDHVWSTSPYHVDGLHEDVEQAVRYGIQDANWSEGPSPIGLVLRGQKGSGKTHLLGWVRREVQRQEGYFFLVALTRGDAFWNDVAAAVRTGLLRSDDAGESQLMLFLRRLCVRIGAPEAMTEAVLGNSPLTAEHLQAFVSFLRRIDQQTGRECADTARALVLFASPHEHHNDVAESYLTGQHDPEDNGRRAWGMRPAAKRVEHVVQEISRLLALTGPSVMAVDQLDTLVAKSTELAGNSKEDAKLARELALFADGLMSLRERTRRTLSLIACLENSWQKLKDKAVASVADRFRETTSLHRISDPKHGRALVEAWLAVPYRQIEFTPPHPTWPVAPSAFEAWDEYTPRELLKRISNHVEACLRNGHIGELPSFDGHLEAVEPGRGDGPEPAHLAELDARFAELRAAVVVDPALDERTEDEVMPGYLSAALRSWITEVGNDDMAWEAESQPHGTSVVHAGLHRVVDEELDVEEHWAFRAIAATHHLSALHRLRNARAAAGVGANAEGRHLILIRNIEWSKGAKTRAELEEFEAAGGRVMRVEEDDLRTFGALEEMLRSHNYELSEWLVARKPASRSALLRELLPSPAGTRGDEEPADPGRTATDPGRRAADGPDAFRPPSPTAIDLGVTDAGVAPVRIDLESLRKHIVVFAGSGSGKTVLIRRVVEECALRGVSAIVLDPNNDLARLGDAWPSPPPEWTGEDKRAAAEYLANTDVVVWTPGRAAGRPISFHPLPDFASVLDDHDEFTAAVDAAVATLAPHAKVTGGTDKAGRSRAVLREALTHFATTGARGLRGFVDLLADLPAGVSRLDSGVVIAAHLAETLKAAMVNDPLFGGAGDPADPSVLLTPAPGKRARVSVISFIGLPTDEQRQAFVNQLQMEVFSWFKRNPAGDRPLGGLFVMDEAQTLAPSGSATASTRSTIILASQARKYGLGLLFATQAPKGLHNQITGNATTQFFGRLNSPAQIAAANDMARAKGSAVGDISLLARGQFYVTGETFGFRRMQSALCLTHHPPSPLRLEEVLDRARPRRPD